MTRVDDYRAGREREAATRRKQPWVYLGVDLASEVRKMLSELGLTRSAPKITLRHSLRTGSTGRAWRHRVVVTIGRDAKAGRVLELLLHELCHVKLPDVGHSEQFIGQVVRAARALWGVQVDGWLTIERGEANKRAYAVDEVILHELQARIESGAYVPAAAKAAPEPLTAAARGAARTAKREARARAMLQEHMSKLSREQKLVRKWRAKVTYYERAAVAAKGRATPAASKGEP